MKFTIIALVTGAVLLAGCGGGQHETQRETEISEALTNIRETVPIIKTTKESLDAVRGLYAEGKECYVERDLPCIEQISQAIKARRRIIETEGKKLQAILTGAKSPTLMQEALKQYKRETGRDIQAELEELAYRASAKAGIPGE